MEFVPHYLSKIPKVLFFGKRVVFGPAREVLPSVRGGSGAPSLPLPAVMGAEAARPAHQVRLQEANRKSHTPGKAVRGPWAFPAAGAWPRSSQAVGLRAGGASPNPGGAHDLSRRPPLSGSVFLCKVQARQSLAGFLTCATSDTLSQT